MTKQWNTEVYLFTESEDRDYFIDNTKSNPAGLCERFNITLSRRPNIPSAEMRYDTKNIHSRHGEYARETGYGNIELELHFNYINERNAKETYYGVAGYLGRFNRGSRIRFSDDSAGFFWELDRKPILEPLNNDLLQWGDFVIRFILKPFRTIEERRVTFYSNYTRNFTAPYPNPIRTPQIVTHSYSSGQGNLALERNNRVVYTADRLRSSGIVVNGDMMHAHSNNQNLTTRDMFNLSLPNRYVQLNDSHFDSRGEYIGSHRYVIIPEWINGSKVTSYDYMFYNSSVRGVASPSIGVTSMSSMFSYATSSEIELDYLFTPDLENMSNMFAYSNISRLDLSSFNTSKVNNMGNVFQNLKMTELIINSFDTAGVSNFAYMFGMAEISELDLSSFGLSSAGDGMWVLGSMPKMGVVYARTQADADIINSNPSLQGKIIAEVGGRGYIPPNDSIDYNIEDYPIRNKNNKLRLGSNFLHFEAGDNELITNTTATIRPKWYYL